MTRSRGKMSVVVEHVWQINADTRGSSETFSR